ncbi:MAG: sugar ABC transporter ATP-binding protein [Saccharofermentanales bacterium]|jgi:ABC-type sugar transport system ATPase subunit
MSSYIEIRNISKQFYGIYALKNISFQINRGDVHAIVGENGAGKSTLMKILGGVYSSDGGEIYIDGKLTKINSVSDAASCGINVIYQEFNLIPELTVAENIFISNTPKKRFFGIVEKKKRFLDTRKLLNELEIDVDPNEYVKNLSVSQKQMVEIAKALSQNSSIIIMDEPTAALNESEVSKLAEIVHKLKRDNKTILYISHRLKEVFDMADKVTVLRNGEYVNTIPTNDTNEAEIIKMMVGHEIDNTIVRPSHATNRVLLEVNELTLEGVFSDVSFKLHEGEILGVAGLMGCGREEMLSSVYGLIKYDSGEVILSGKKIGIRSPRDAIKNGICFLTDDRKDAGLFPLMSVEENITIMSISNLKKRLGFYINPSDEHAQLEQMTDYMKIKFAGPDQKITYLSGGNQQKVLLGRGLLLDSKIFIMLEPTRGIDVGAKEEIYDLLQELAKKGMGIIAVFSDMNELIKVCDRVLAFWDGKVVGELGQEEFDKERILTLIANQAKEGVRC